MFSDITIMTPRLSLRQFKIDDAPFIIQLLNDKSFIDSIGDKKVKSIEDAIKYLTQGPIASYALYGFGFYQVSLIASNEPIGMCGLVKRDELQHPDLGYAFLTPFHGQGYASEAATAVIDNLRHSKKLSTIAAIADTNNTASNNVLTKQGFSLNSIIDFKGCDANYYLINF